MIEALNVSKRFGKIKALDNIQLQIEDGGVFGVVGTNGAGKSTLLRLIAGVLKPTSGSVCVDARPVYDNPQVKRDVFFIADEAYYFANSAPDEMARYYAMLYPKFDMERFARLLDTFALDRAQKIATFSKGMKKQLFICLGFASGVKYLLMDETFDGLDPVARQGVKSLFAGQIADVGMTPVVASHSLRELEDICDHIGLLHKGGVLLSEDVEAMKLNLQKIQCVFATEWDEKKAIESLKPLAHETRGRLHTITIRATREEALARFEAFDTVFFELLTLSLEEVFISETEAVGYDVKKFILA